MIIALLIHVLICLALFIPGLRYIMAPCLAGREIFTKCYRYIHLPLTYSFRSATQGASSYLTKSPTAKSLTSILQRFRSMPQAQLSEAWFKTWKWFYSDGKCPLKNGVLSIHTCPHLKALLLNNNPCGQEFVLVITLYNSVWCIHWHIQRFMQHNFLFLKVARPSMCSMHVFAGFVDNFFRHFRPEICCGTQPRGSRNLLQRFRSTP